MSENIRKVVLIVGVLILLCFVCYILKCVIRVSKEKIRVKEYRFNLVNFLKSVKNPIPIKLRAYSSRKKDNGDVDSNLILSNIGYFQYARKELKFRFTHGIISIDDLYDMRIDIKCKIESTKHLETTNAAMSAIILSASAVIVGCISFFSNVDLFLSCLIVAILLAIVNLIYNYIIEQFRSRIRKQNEIILLEAVEDTIKNCRKWKIHRCEKVIIRCHKGNCAKTNREDNTQPVSGGLVQAEEEQRHQAEVARAKMQ